MEARLRDALRLVLVEHVANLALGKKELTYALVVILLAKWALVSLEHALGDAGSVCIRVDFHVALGAGRHAAVIVEDEVVLAYGAMLARILALCAPWRTFSANSVLSQRHPDFCSAFGTLTHASFSRFKHFETCSALRTDEWVYRIASLASRIAKVTSSDLTHRCISVLSGYSDTWRAYVHACIGVKVKVLIRVARSTKIG